MAVCPNCNGQKKIYGPQGVLKMNAGWKECPSCGLKGEVSGRWRKCEKCTGWGQVGYVFISPDPCPECNARGIVPDEPPEEPATRRRGHSIRIELD